MPNENDDVSRLAKGLAKELKEYTDLRYSLIENKLNMVVDDIKDVQTTLRSSYVTEDQFSPVKTVVYGLVGIILTSVIGAILTIILTNKG